MHILKPMQNTDTIFPCNTAAKNYELWMSVESLCTQTGRLCRKIMPKIAVFMMNSFWKNKCLQQKVSAGCSFFFCKRQQRWGELVCYLLEMWTLVIWRQILGEYINIYICTSLFFLVNLSSIWTTHDFMAKNKEQIKYCGKFVAG